MTIIISAAILSGLILAPLGCLVLWKKYVYLGDGLSHSALLVGVLSTTAGIPIFYSSIINAALFITAFIVLKSKSGNNATIAMTSSLMIACAIILTSIFPSKVNINGMLFGDILSTNNHDLKILIYLLIAIIIYLFFYYKNLILISFSRDIAHSRDIKVKLIELSFLSILSFAILVTIKIVGAFLVTSILLIPAMTARILASSPFAMLFYSILVALTMNISGIIVSLHFDLPFAPVIVLSGGLLYIMMLVMDQK